MADTTFVCSSKTTYFQEHNSILFSVKERMEGRMREMIRNTVRKIKKAEMAREH
jgi:hypothetical protein